MIVDTRIFRAKIYRFVLMYECMDMQPISTWMARREGWRCFVFLHWESSIWGDGKLGWGFVINTPGPRSSGRLEVRLVTRVNTRGTWPLTLLMGHRKPSMNWYPLCHIPPQDLSHSQLSPTSPPPPKKHTGYLWHQPQQQTSNGLFRSGVRDSHFFWHHFLKSITHQWKDRWCLNLTQLLQLRSNYQATGNNTSPV